MGSYFSIRRTRKYRRELLEASGGGGPVGEEKGGEKTETALKRGKANGMKRKEAKEGRPSLTKRKTTWRHDRRNSNIPELAGGDERKKGCHR